MKYLAILISTILMSQMVFASFGRPTLTNPSQTQTSNQENDEAIRADMGLIVNEETSQVYCKFTRQQSPQSFPAFVEPVTRALTESEIMKDSQYDAVPFCNEEQIGHSVAVARESMNQQVKVAALPAAALVAVCGIAVLDGVLVGLTFGADAQHNSDIMANIGMEGIGWWLYSSVAKSGMPSSLVLAGLKTIVKTNFVCSGTGILVGAGVRGIAYISRK